MRNRSLYYILEICKKTLICFLQKSILDLHSKLNQITILLTKTKLNNITNKDMNYRLNLKLRTKI